MDKASRRPYEVDNLDDLRSRFREWLTSRGGIVVYENRMLDSSACGARTYMPAMYYAEGDDELHPAPPELRPHGGLPSRRQQRIDHIKVEDFDGDPDRTIDMCFVNRVS